MILKGSKGNNEVERKFLFLKVFINETFEIVTFSYGGHFLFECLTHKNGLKREIVDKKIPDTTKKHLDTNTKYEPGVAIHDSGWQWMLNEYCRVMSWKALKWTSLEAHT